MELGIFKTAMGKSSPFMQFCLQILTTYPKTPLSSLETLSSTMEMDIAHPQVNSLPLSMESIRFYGPTTQTRVPPLISVDLWMESFELIQEYMQVQHYGRISRAILLQNWRKEISSGLKLTIIVLPLYMKIIHTCLDTKLMAAKLSIATLYYYWNKMVISIIQIIYACIFN